PAATPLHDFFSGRHDCFSVSADRFDLSYAKQPTEGQGQLTGDGVRRGLLFLRLEGRAQVAPFVSLLIAGRPAVPCRRVVHDASIVPRIARIVLAGTSRELG